MKSTEMNSNNEPPSCTQSWIFLIGQNSRGNWVVQDESGIRGGLFVGRAEALRYIRFESAARKQNQNSETRNVCFSLFFVERAR